ncbi:MAG: aminoglycoside 6-adenylyltransferase [Gemmatimonadetes bacterium]|nr:aminoglycoside 6-adenylyltransferase [Gemmatimonadota bacterium]
MTTRTEDEMLALILGFARADDRIRAVLMNGSRVNPNAEKDIFRDYDIAFFVTDLVPFREEKNVVPYFGVPLLVEKVEDQVYRPGIRDGRYTYNVQFSDGNRIDMAFLHVELAETRTFDSLTRVLLDKDGLIPDLPGPSERSFFITKPTQKWYADCCDSFCFSLGSHVPKALWRRQLPVLKCHIGRLRQDLVLMLGWYIGVTKGFERSLGSEGKNLEEHLEAEDWREFERTCAGSDYDDITESLQVIHRLFVRTAQTVGNHYGYRFPIEKAESALAFLMHVSKLPRDAQSIFSGSDEEDDWRGVPGKGNMIPFFNSEESG